MNVGMVGLGKLGLPVAVALGNDPNIKVIGYDINPELMKKRKYPHKEYGLYQDNFQDLFNIASIEFASLEEVCNSCEFIFVTVQTPHVPGYEGITRMPDERADFNYTYLIECARQLAKYVKPHNVVVIVSTVLPGTLRKHILPVLAPKCSVVYNPLFIAMGTVFKDFVDPEFVLLGAGDNVILQRMQNFYQAYYGKDLSVPMSIESAELTKVAYNTFVSLKIVYANTLMEICHKTPNCNIDDVIGAISKAKDRLISPKYLQGGMGDGGGCHPRDNIAMSWLAQKLDLSHDIFTENIIAREKQANWLVNLMIENRPEVLPKIILGKSFKPETNITTGSPAILCANILKEKNIPFKQFDPFIDNIADFRFVPAIYLIGVKHNFFKDLIFPEGSFVIDPFRYIPDQKNVIVIRVGE